MEKLCKSVALETAFKAVTSPEGHGSSWVVFAPYDTRNIKGPSTTILASSYSAIISRRSECVAEIALALMGFTGRLYSDGLGGGAREILNRALADPQRYIIPREA